MNSIELVYFKKNNQNLFVAETDENCIALRQYLKILEVEQTQYFSDHLSCADDIVDDLLSDYMNVICFMVNQENEDFTYTVAEMLHNSEEDSELLFLVSDDVTREFVFGTSIPVGKFLEKLPDIDQEVTLSNAYKNKLLPVQLCSKIGIIMNRFIPILGKTSISTAEGVMSEIKYASNYVSSDSRILLVSEKLSEYPYLDELIGKLRDLNINQKIFIRVLDQMVTQQTVDKLSGANITLLGDPEDRKDNSALLNGLQAFHMGYYFNQEETSYTKHIQIDEEELNEDMFKKLAQHNAANSAIYGMGSHMDQNYQTIKKMAVASGYLFTNFLHFCELESSNEFEVNINEDQVTRVRIESYSKYRGKENKDVYLSIVTAEDLKCYLNDIDEFNRTGYVRHDRMWLFDYLDKCRWSTVTNCSLDKLPRFRVKSGEVYPCLTCNHPIGTVEELHFELLRDACVHLEEEQMKRGCDTCSQRKACVKCTMLPDSLSRERYCEIMKSDRDVVGYSRKMMMIRAFFEYCSIKNLEEVSVSEIQFSTDGNQIEINNVENDDNNVFGEFVLLARIPRLGSYILLNWKTKKALSVNKNFFIIAELISKCRDEDFVVNYLVKNYGMSQENAKSNLFAALNILHERGFLKDGILRKVI